MIFCVLIHVFLSYSNLGYLIMRWYYILYFYKAFHTFFFIFFPKTIYATRWSWSPSSKVSRKLIIILRMWTQHETLSLIELKICLTLDGLSCLPINKPFLSTMLKKIVLNHCLHWRKVNTAISDFIQSTYPK